MVTMVTMVTIVTKNISGACFNHTEDLIIAPDEKGMAIGCWDARTAEPHPHLVSGKHTCKDT